MPKEGQQSSYLNLSFLQFPANIPAAIFILENAQSFTECKYFYWMRLDSVDRSPLSFWLTGGAEIDRNKALTLELNVAVKRCASLLRQDRLWLARAVGQAAAGKPAWVMRESCSDEITVLKRYFHPTPRLKVCKASEGLVDEDEDSDWQLTRLRPSVKISSVSSEYSVNAFNVSPFPRGRTSSSFSRAAVSQPDKCTF